MFFPPVRTHLPFGLFLRIAFLFLTALPAAPADSTNSPTTQALEKANQLFKQEHWAEARSAYDEVRNLAKDWASPSARLSVEGAVACSLKLSLWDDALARAQQFVT